MPAYSSTDIAHTASTDHRIPRRPGPEDRHGEEPRTAYTLALLHRDGLDPGDPEYRRDLALALARLEGRGGGAKGVDTRDADPLLDEAVKNFPDDVDAWEERGWLAVVRDQPARALGSCQACLALAPRREIALIGAAWTAQNLGKAEALDYWRRAVAVDPWSPLPHANLAAILAARGEWGQARAQCDEWVRLQPETVEARKLRIRCLLHTGDRDGAEADLKTLKGLQPGSDADLDHWFAKQRP
jgi:tetratricopeptide (TPR) repeat protein